MLPTAFDPTTNDVVQLLSDPHTYAERTSKVERVETHISWLFLTDHHVYKLKKPVRFDFVDFSTSKARQRACVEEIRLNKRLTHGVYHAVLPINVDLKGKLSLDGDGVPIDYVVEMRRLPKGLTLDQLISQRRLDSRQLDELVDYLVNYYTQLPPKIARPDEYYQRLVENCRANRSSLLQYATGCDLQAVHRIHGAQLRLLWLEKDRFQNRVRDGRIVDGHGDLRAEHVYLESPPSVIDCVEFSEELRQVDVVDDLSYLAMDCDRLGNHEVGHRLFSVYEQLSGDEPSVRMLDYFKCYRACVRAKVSALCLQQLCKSQRKRLCREFRQYLQWADHYALCLGRPMLIVIGGVMGTGKTTVASAVAETIACKALSTDGVRQSLLGPSKTPIRFGEGNYQPELRRRVYRELLNQAKTYLNTGQSVVLDGTFLTNELRQQALRFGEQHGAVSVFVECVCHKAVAQLRIAERSEQGTNQSEAKPEFFDQQNSQRESPSSSLRSIRVDTTNSIVETMDTLAKELKAFDGIG